MSLHTSLMRENMYTEFVIFVLITNSYTDITNYGYEEVNALVHRISLYQLVYMVLSSIRLNFVRYFCILMIILHQNIDKHQIHLWVVCRKWAAINVLLDIRTHLNKCITHTNVKIKRFSSAKFYNNVRRGCKTIRTIQ